MAEFFIEMLVIYKIESDSFKDAVEKARNMVVGETPAVVEQVTPTGRYGIKQK